jgi:long-chain acyl-CoA synthetase
VALDFSQHEALAGLEYRNLTEIYEHSIQTYADRRLYGVKRQGTYEWISYGDFGERVERCRAALSEAGIGRDDTAAVIADNRPDWAVAAYATYTLGARWCPMYESQARDDWKYIINDSGAKVIFVADQEIRQALTAMDEAGDIDVDQIIHFEGPAEGSFDAFLDSTEASVEAVDPDGDTICGLIYTSGTTGDPKGVLLSHRNIASNIEAIHGFDLIAEDDISLSFLPWAHSFGQTAEMHGMFSIGAACALVEDITTITENLNEVRPTLLFSVPRIFSKIYDGVHRKIEEEGALKRRLFDKAMQNSERLRREQQSGQASTTAKLLDKFYDRVIFSKVRERFGGRLKYAISGGAKLNEEVAYFIDNLHILVCEGYGLTETSPLVSVNVPGQRKIGSVGMPVPGVEVRIDTDAEHDDPEEDHVRGEVLVRGPNVMKGYYNKPEKTAEVLDAEGWFHSGDLGRLDEDGYLWIEGRAKEEYKLENGKFVSPGRLEEQLKLAPHIDQVMVEGHNQPFNIAIVNVDKEQLASWAKKHGVEADDLIEHPQVRELLEAEVAEHSRKFKAYERPKEVLLVDDEWSPENGVLTPTMKLKRRVIMEMYADDIDAIYERA